MPRGWPWPIAVFARFEFARFEFGPSGALIEGIFKHVFYDNCNYPPLCFYA